MYVLIFSYLLTLFFALKYRYWNNNFQYSLKAVPRFSYWFCFSLLLFVTAFRYDVGYDYLTYYNYIIDSNSWIADNWEPFPLLMIQISQFFNAPVIFFFVYAFLILFFIFKGAERNSYSPFESIIIFMSMFWLDSLSIMRQALACAILFWAFKYVRQKSFIKYFCCVLLAGCSHASAILGLPIFFLYNVKNPKKIIFPLLTLVIIIAAGLEEYIHALSIDRYQDYLTDVNGKNNGSSKSVYFFYILYVISIISTYSQRSKNLEYFRYLAIITPAIVFPSILGAQTGLRAGLYYNIYYLLLLPEIMNTVFKQKCIGQVYLFLFLLYFLLILIVDANNNQGYTHYHLYFFKDFI